MTEPTPRPEPHDEHLARTLESFDLRDAMLAGLAASANDLAEVARSLYKNSVMSRVERAVVGILLLGLTVTSVVTLVTLLRLNNVAQQNRTNNAYVRECTTPGTADAPHQCFDDNQKRTAVLIGQLNRSTLYTVVCGRLYATEDDITKCVTDRLAAGTKSGG